VSILKHWGTYQKAFTCHTDEPQLCTPNLSELITLKWPEFTFVKMPEFII
jgi:hypothetical protein